MLLRNRAGCGQNDRSPCCLALPCAWSLVALLLGLASVPAAADSAHRLIPDLASGGGSGPLARRDGTVGSAGSDRIVLAARDQKPEPGRTSGSNNNNGGSGNNNNGGSGAIGGVSAGAEAGNAIRELAAPAISDPSECGRTPQIEGRGGGEATHEQISVCYAVLAMREIGAHAKIAFSTLADGLASDDRRVRRRAAADIGQISGALSRAMPLLVAALGDTNVRVQKTAAKVVTDIGEYAAEVVPALERIAADHDPLVARAGVQSLVDLGPYAVAGLPTLSDSLNSDDLGVRFYAGDGLSRVDSQMRSTARAIQRLSSRYSDTSTAAVRDLANALQDDRTGFRERAVLTLATIGPRGREQIDQLPTDVTDVDTIRSLGDISRFATAAAPSLVVALADPDYPGRRSDAGEIDVAIGSERLLAALKDDRQDVRVSSAEALRDTSSAVTQALAVLKGAPRDDIFVRQAARSAVGTIDAYSAEAVPALLAALKDEDPDVRRASVQTLGQLGPSASQAVPDLVGALRSDTVEVQSAAALALGQIGTQPATTVPALAEALHHPDPAVRYRAARALGLMGPEAKPAVPELEAALDRGDGALRYQAARALQVIDPASEPGNLAALDRGMKREVADLLADVKGDDPGRRRAAVLYLGSIGPAAIDVVPELASALADAEPGSRRNLETALQTISSEARAEVSILVDKLQRGDPETRAQTAEALGAIGADAQTAKATLVAALAEPDLPVDVRLVLAEAVGEIGAYTTEVTRALVESALRDPDPEVRDNAKDSLGEQAAEV